MRRADNLTTFMCRMSWNLGASTSWKPQGLSRPVMGLFYLFTLPFTHYEWNTSHFTHHIQCYKRPASLSIPSLLSLMVSLNSMYAITCHFLVVTNRWLVKSMVDTRLMFSFLVTQNIIRWGRSDKFGVPYISFRSLSSLPASSSKSVMLF